MSTLIWLKCFTPMPSPSCYFANGRSYSLPLQSAGHFLLDLHHPSFGVASCLEHLQKPCRIEVDRGLPGFPGCPNGRRKMAMVMVNGSEGKSQAENHGVFSPWIYAAFPHIFPETNPLTWGKVMINGTMRCSSHRSQSRLEPLKPVSFTRPLMD